MRGDVVLLDYPFTDASGAKVRPALEVGNDAHASINAIVVQITSQLGRTGPTRYLIDPTTPEGQLTGPYHPSLVACDMPYTVHRRRIIRRIGHLSPAMMVHVDQCLKSALALS